MAELLRSAVHQGRDSHARHEFDERMQALVTEFGNDGAIPLYGAAVGRMRDRLTVTAAPRPVPGQREGEAAA
jgi:proteasome assembly chaperone (PAC2) family protein